MLGDRPNSKPAAKQLNLFLVSVEVMVVTKKALAPEVKLKSTAMACQ